MIQAIDICKSFEGRLVLDHVSATFQPGKTNLIIGQSGSGKTVLLKSLVGLHQIDSGQILYDKLCFSGAPLEIKREIRQKLGMIFQGGALLDSSTVIENVMFPLDLFTDMSQSEKEDRANFCLQRVNLTNANHLYPSELSGGMIKRVAIARAIVMNPQYLFCDEPNSGLDPKTSVVIDNLIQEITQEYNITTIIFIYQGRKWWEGTKDDILDTDNKELEAFIFASAMARKVRNNRNK